MGNDQKRKSNYSDNDDDEEKDEDIDVEKDEEKDEDNCDEIKINKDTENSSSSYEKRVDDLDEMNLSIEEVKEKFDFYKNNYDKLLKINKIIKNIKFADLYDSSPQDILFKLIPATEIKYDNPDYGLQKKRQKSYYKN